MDVVLVYVTLPDPETARALARTVVSERLASCANILDGMHSLYWWRGTLEEAQETVCLFKTRADLFTALERRVCALHPYETPCVLAFPATGGHGPFLQWIVEETSPGTAGAQP